jgi:hypothetical protein
MISPLPKPPRIVVPKPFPRPFPIPKRLPKRMVKMTLVAAFRCSSGAIMLLADREENDVITRREVDKIYKINMFP